MKAAPASLLVLAVLLAAGCGGGSKKATTTGAGGLSAAQIARQTAAKTAKLRSFHFVFETRNPATSTSGLNLTSAEGDVVVPGKLKAKVAGTLSGVSLSSHLVFVAPQQYLENPLSGKWETFRMGMSPLGYFDPAKGVLAVIRQSLRLRLNGSDTVGGVDCYRLSGKVRARVLASFLRTPKTDRLVDVDLDVGKEDLLLRRIRVSGPATSSEPAQIERDVTLSRFDEPVTITPPKVGS